MPRSYRRIKEYEKEILELKEQGLTKKEIGQKLGLRFEQKYNLLSEVRRKKYRNYSKVLHKSDNLLDRDFNADKPNQKWVTDVSYIKTGQGTLYLFVIRDYSSIVAYKTDTEQNINLILSTIRAAKEKEKVTAELQLHSD